MTTLELLPLPRSLGFTGRPGISSVASTPFVKVFKMDQSKKGFLPVLQGVRLSSAQCPTTAEDIEEMSVIPYASAIGSIMYAMLCTRPDVSLAVSLVGRYQSNPGMEH